MNKKVAIVDYGIGNILSVRRAFEHVGAEVALAADEKSIAQAAYLVLPGVGAFRDGMSGLRARGLVDAIAGHALAGRPLMGICLGAQMLMSGSEEFGRHDGLNLISGQVVRIPAVDQSGNPQKLPFIGWADLQETSPGSFADTPLKVVGPQEAVYLVHSYYIQTDMSAHCIAEYHYGGRAVTAAIRADNVFGFQFHPEKSGPVGLRILDAFLTD